MFSAGCSPFGFGKCSQSVTAWSHGAAAFSSGLMYCRIQGHSWIPSPPSARAADAATESPLTSPSPFSSFELPRGNDDHTKGEKRISRQSRSTRPTDGRQRQRPSRRSRSTEQRSRRRSLVAVRVAAASLRETFAASATSVLSDSESAVRQSRRFSRWPRELWFGLSAKHPEMLLMTNIKQQ